MLVCFSRFYSRNGQGSEQVCLQKKTLLITPRHSVIISNICVCKCLGYLTYSMISFQKESLASSSIMSHHG